MHHDIQRARMRYLAFHIELFHLKLYLQIDSAPLKKELIMAKQKMIELINKHAGKTVIQEVIFL